MRPSGKMPSVVVGVTAVIVDAGPIVAWLNRVFTTDSGFAIYRRHGRQVVPLLVPPEE
jgi:hypothetical protein